MTSYFGTYTFFILYLENELAVFALGMCSFVLYRARILLLGDTV
jgi:hypothetical protein